MGLNIDMSEGCNIWTRIPGIHGKRDLRDIVVIAICWNIWREQNNKNFNYTMLTIYGCDMNLKHSIQVGYETENGYVSLTIK